MLSPILHSFVIAVSSTALAFLIMLPVSYIGAYHSFKGKWLLEIFLLLPLILPPTVVGLYLLRSFGKYGWIGKLLGHLNYSLVFTLQGAIIATTIIILPLLYQGMKGAFKSVPTSLIHVAQTLAASPSEILWRVILPNCWTSILASILLAFCRAIGEFGASLMVAGYIEGKTDTISSAIYFAIQQSDEHKALILSGFDIILGIGILFFIQCLTYLKGEKE